MSPREPALRLDRRFTHLVRMGDSIVLVGDDDSLLLESDLVADIVRRVDGRRTAVDIAEELEDIHSPALVHFFLLKAVEEGVLGPVQVGEGLAVQGPDSDEDVSSEASLLSGSLLRAWEGRPDGNSGVHFRFENRLGKTFSLILTDDFLNPGLETQRDETVQEREPCLLARVGAAEVWVGPWVVPGQTGCICCLQERLRINLMARAIVHLPQDTVEARGIEMEALARAFPPTMWTRLAMGILDESPVLESPTWIRVLSLEGEEDEIHPVDRLPHCAACGDPTLAPPGADFQLKSDPLVSSSGGGFRAVEAAETIRTLKPLVSPLTGVIRYVRKVEVACAEDVHVYTANHAHFYGAVSFKTLRADGRDHGGGKGMTDEDARASAMCESLERFSAVYRGSEPVTVARRSELDGESIHPNDLLLFSEAQFREREVWNAEKGKGFQWVTEPYEDEIMEWSEARSLVDGRVRFVPSAAVYLGFTGEGRRFCRGDSNGLASGNTLEEAILQGFLELAERDSVALWWYNRAPRPALDLGTFRHPRVDETVALYERLRRDLWVLDLTSDLEIPTFAALSARPSAKLQDIFFGFGAHLDPDIALLRALSELNQMLPTIERTPQERRRQLLPAFPEAIDWWEKETLERHPYLLPDGSVTARERSHFLSPSFKDLESAVCSCVERAERAGLDCLVHDLNRPDVRFPVARVMVPGLRHFWRRLGPGRLCEVPIKLGWQRGSKDEASFNPVSMFV